MNSNLQQISTSSNRRSWVERDPKETLVLTARDKQIIKAVWQYRFLSSSQIRELFFSSKSKADRRLRELYDHGFIDRIAIPVVQGRGELIYALWDKGAEILSRDLGLERKELKWNRQRNRIQPQFMQHELNLGGFRMAVEKETGNNAEIKLLFWHNGEELRTKLRTQFTASNFVSNKGDLLRPDAFFGIETTKGKLYFFVEVDRGTESLPVIRQKAHLYSSGYTKGGFELELGIKKFRSLFISETEDRMVKLVSATKESLCPFLFWFTSQSAVDGTALFSRKIWSVAGNSQPMSLL